MLSLWATEGEPSEYDPDELRYQDSPEHAVQVSLGILGCVLGKKGD